MKTILTILATLILTGMVFSQTMYVHSKSNPKPTSFLISDIDSITFSYGAPNSNQYVIYGDSGDIFIAKIDGYNRVNLTNDPAIDVYPQPSTDGSKISFVSGRGGSYNIWIMNIDGSNPCQLTVNDSGGMQNGYGSAAWLNNSELVYTHADSVIKINADGTNATPIYIVPANRHAHTVVDSMSGQKIAVQTVGGWGYIGEIYVMDSDGSNSSIVLPDWPGGQFVGSFTPDANYLLYVYDPSGHEDAGGWMLDGNIYKVSLSDTSQRTNLSVGKTANTNDLHPRISNDGSKICFAHGVMGDPIQSIWLMAMNGQNRVMIIPVGFDPVIW